MLTVEEKREYDRQYYRTRNKEKLLEAKKRYRDSHKEKIKEYQKKWYQEQKKNKEIERAARLILKF